MYVEAPSQPLASNVVVAVKDFEVLDYISTSHIRKLLCYWKSDSQHPRVLDSNMIWLHLMAIRPGSKLCDEHRLRLRFLPLRINLDSDVIDFLKGFGKALTSSSTTENAAPALDSAAPMNAAATTVFGVVPLLSDTFWEGLAVTIMFGLAFGTILTMVVVPVLYTLFYRLKPETSA